jgi:hypothetical protein
MKLAGYLLRAPIALVMRCDAATGTVIYRSKMHLGLKRNFQVMPGAKVSASPWRVDQRPDRETGSLSFYGCTSIKSKQLYLIPRIGRSSTPKLFPCGWWEREAGADQKQESPHAEGFL